MGVRVRRPLRRGLLVSRALGVIVLAAVPYLAHASDRVLRADLTIAAPVAER